MARKTKRQQLKEKIFRELQDRYHVTGRELASGSFIYGNGNITAEDVLSDFEQEFGVELEKKEFSNWTEFAESLADRVVRTRKF